MQRKQVDKSKQDDMIFLGKIPWENTSIPFPFLDQFKKELIFTCLNTRTRVLTAHGRAVAVCAAEGAAMQAAASCTLIFLYISFLYMFKHLLRHRWGCVFSTSTQTIRLFSLSCLLSCAGPKLSNTDLFFTVSRSNLA